MQKSRLSSHKILILEDTEEDAELLRWRLQETGLNLDLGRAISKATYLDELDRFAPRITISDYELPCLHGYFRFQLAREKGQWVSLHNPATNQAAESGA